MRNVAADAPTTTVDPVRDNALLLNPGKGWVEYNLPSPEFRDVVSTGYARIMWSKIEPSEGKFDWTVFDGFIDAWANEGKKCSISVINFDGGMGQEYSIPKWVFGAGAVPFLAPDPSTPTGKIVLPETWDDPVYLEKMKAFIAKFGERYNGSPNLAFVDIRDYGNSGELNGNCGGLNNTSLANLLKYYIEPYIEAFSRTQLIIPWTASWFDGKPANPVYEWAVSHGVGIRRDGICSKYSKDGSECMPAFGHEPAILEYCWGWPETEKTGYSSPEILMKYVEGAKPSYIQFQPEFYRANKEFCHMLGNKMGYHFILEHAVFPKTIRSGLAFPITLKWLNDGIAPLYEPCHVALAILDSKGNVIEKHWLADSNPQKWMPGVSTVESFHVIFASVPPRGYELAVGLFLNQSDANPIYRLGIRGRTSDGWYVLSGEDKGTKP